jgi:hypothetical protein
MTQINDLKQDETFFYPYPRFLYSKPILGDDQTVLLNFYIIVMDLF